jgi:hypothetical protein
MSTQRPGGQPDDPLPGMIAEIDQLVAVAPQLARAVHGIYSAYRDQGFSDAQAIYLVAATISDNPLDPPH